MLSWLCSLWGSSQIDLLRMILMCLDSWDVHHWDTAFFEKLPDLQQSLDVPNTPETLRQVAASDMSFKPNIASTCLIDINEWLLSNDHLELLACRSHMLTPRLRKTAKTLKVMLFRLKSLQDQWWWSHSSANPTIKLQVVGSQPQNVNIIDSKASATELFGVLQQQLFLGRFPVHGSCQQRLWRSPCRAVVWCLNPHAVRDTSIYIYVCVYMTYEYMNNQQITKETNIYIYTI